MHGSEAYRKKRRHGDVGSDVEDWEGISSQNEKVSGSFHGAKWGLNFMARVYAQRDYRDKDALADFRSEIADEEARYRQRRDTVPVRYLAY